MAQPTSAAALISILSEPLGEPPAKPEPLHTPPSELGAVFASTAIWTTLPPELNSLIISYIDGQTCFNWSMAPAVVEYVVSRAFSSFQSFAASMSPLPRTAQVTAAPPLGFPEMAQRMQSGANASLGAHLTGTMIPSWNSRAYVHVAECAACAGSTEVMALFLRFQTAAQRSDAWDSGNKSLANAAKAGDLAICDLLLEENPWGHSAAGQASCKYALTRAAMSEPLPARAKADPNLSTRHLLEKTGNPEWKGALIDLADLLIHASKMSNTSLAKEVCAWNDKEGCNYTGALASKAPEILKAATAHGDLPLVQYIVQKYRAALTAQHIINACLGALPMNLSRGATTQQIVKKLTDMGFARGTTRGSHILFRNASDRQVVIPGRGSPTPATIALINREFAGAKGTLPNDKKAKVKSVVDYLLGLEIVPLDEKKKLLHLLN